MAVKTDLFTDQYHMQTLDKRRRASVDPYSRGMANERT